MRILVPVAAISLSMAASRGDARPAGLAPAARTPAPRVWPDDRGTIREILLQYDPSMHLQYAPALEDLLAALPPDVRIKVVCAFADAADVFIAEYGALAGRGGRQVEVISADADISVWARDRAIPRYDPGTGRPGATLLPALEEECAHWQRNELETFPRLVSAGLIDEMDCTPLRLEGGNVVANGRHAFVGYNALLGNEAHDSSPEDVEELIEKALGVDTIFVSDDFGEVPWVHVDMYLTPIDDCTVLLASPTFGESLVRSPTHGFEDAALRAFASEEAESLEVSFDEIAALLAAYDYDVYRIPAAISPAGGWMMTYNNVLMETRGGKRIVYMPAYGVPETDDMARAIYRSLGFEVHDVDVSELFIWGGTVRCITSVTERNLGPAPSTDTATRGGPGAVVFIDLSECASFDVDEAESFRSVTREDSLLPEGSLSR